MTPHRVTFFKFMELKDYFKDYPEIAIAFSGGVDSSFLFYEANKYSRNVIGYYVKTPFQPQFEFEDAKAFANKYNLKLKVIHFNVLSCPEVTENNPLRCYFCKKRIMSEIMKHAAEDGLCIVADGTNFSDSSDERPGMRALEELKIISPLRECGLTKEEIRRLSRASGLFTADKPAYACLATRIPSGTAITAPLLERTEWAENYLFSLGFSDFRVRTSGNSARLEINRSQLEKYYKLKETVNTVLSEKYDGVSDEIGVRE